MLADGADVLSVIDRAFALDASAQADKIAAAMSQVPLSFLKLFVFSKFFICF
jgi:hypothetical protein